jgi:hypothetical protein
MKKIDLIIDALEVASHVPKGVVYPAGYPMQIAQALAAARELKALKPVAWVVRRTTSEGDVVDGVWTCDSDEEGAIPVYALDEVKHD